MSTLGLRNRLDNLNIDLMFIVYRLFLLLFIATLIYFGIKFVANESYYMAALAFALSLLIGVRNMVEIVLMASNVDEDDE